MALEEAVKHLCIFLMHGSVMGIDWNRSHRPLIMNYSAKYRKFFFFLTCCVCISSTLAPYLTCAFSIFGCYRSHVLHPVNISKFGCSLSSGMAKGVATALWPCLAWRQQRAQRSSQTHGVNRQSVPNTGKLTLKPVQEHDWTSDVDDLTAQL